MALVNRLFVVPTPATLKYLKELFSACPIECPWDSFHVDLMVTQDEIETEPSIIYHAQCGSIGVFYDSARMTSSILLPLHSPEMNIRFEQLCANGVRPQWFPNLKPYMSLMKDPPLLPRKQKGWLNSIADVLVARQTPLEFYSEYVSVETQESPLNVDYLKQ